MLTIRLILERLDKDYRVLDRREQEARSFILSFIRMLYLYHGYVSAYSMPDIGNVSRTVDALAGRHKSNLKIGSPGGTVSVVCHSGFSGVGSHHEDIVGHPGERIGIQVGTGTTAVTPTDIALTTRVAHGRGAGQLEYGGCELVNLAFAAPNGEFTIRRYFTNLSGGSITVNEVGIYSPAGISVSPYTVWVFCIARDIVSPGVAVANGELLRVTYVPQITV